MFNSTFGIDQIGNITQGCICLTYAELLQDQDEIPIVRNRITGPMPVRIRRQHNAGVAPGVIVWRDAEVRIVAICGARAPVDQRNVISGYSNPATSEVHPGRFNSLALTWETSAMNLIATEVAAVSLPTWVFGYSFGGCAGILLAKSLSRNAQRRIALAVTFGMPRFCDATGARLLRETCLARIFHRDDPIPFMIPSSSEAPWAQLCVLPEVSRAWQTFLHVDGGLRLWRNGHLRTGQLPDLVPLPLDVNIQEFVRVNFGDNRPHAISTYRNTLETAYPEEGDQATDPGVIVDELAGGHTPLEPRGEPFTHLAQKREARRVINSRVTVVPHEVGVAGRRRNRKLITIQRYLGYWSVYIGTDRVYDATTKRDARGVANALRAVAIQLGQQPRLWTRDDIIGIIRSYQEPS